MDVYRNKSGISGVVAYEIGIDFIKIKFQENNDVYIYNYQIPGAIHVEIMKQKAMEGMGLATYINKHVHANYFAKIRGD